MNKRKILFILPTLTAGGAERVVSFIAQHINSDKFESTLLITGLKQNTAYQIKNINVVFLEKKRVLNAIPKLFLFIFNYKPNVVLSSLSHLNTVLGLMSPFFWNTKFIIREASVVSVINKFGTRHKNASKLHSLLPHLSYKLVDYIVCQSNDMANDFNAIFKVNKNKTVIINNPITQEYPIKVNHDFNNTKIVKFLTVGRLSNEKGHKRILKILAQLSFEFHYTIIGEGPIKNQLFETITQLNLKDKITHIPFTTQVLKYMSENDMFLQGSYVEGFPNTVLESCLVGTPVTAFNVPGGTKEIIQHNTNGYLVETEAEFLQYLNKPRVWDATLISNSVKERFNKETIINQYEALLMS